jgi:hypothetical protein
MGIINLPAFESTAVEQKAPPQSNPAFQGQAAAGEAQSRFFQTLFKAGTGIAQTLIDTAKTNQLNKAVIDYSKAQQQALLDLEKNPLTSIDPRYTELSDEERLAPNLATFSKWKQKYLDQALPGISIPSARQEFEKWTQEKGLAETETLAKFDISASRALGRQQLADNLSEAVTAGNLAAVVKLVDNATGKFITEAEGREAKSKNFADINARQLFLRSLQQPVAATPETRVGVEAPKDKTGMIRSGNINLDTRPVVHNPDGTISTVNSITITEDQGTGMPGVSTNKVSQVFKLIPTIAPDGKQMSNEEAIAEYRKTGQNLGTFTSEESADKYAVSLSKAMGASVVPPQVGGLEWLADKNNLRYQDWDGEVKTLDLGQQENLINKYRVHLQEVAAERDTFYSDVHIRADTLEKIDQALGILHVDNTMAGDQKYKWETRFEQQRENLEKLAAIRFKGLKDAYDDMMKQKEDQMEGLLASSASKFPNDIRGLLDMLDKAYFRPDPQISSGFYVKMTEKYKRSMAPEYKLFVDSMQKAIDKLPADQQMILMSRAVQWYDDPSHKIAPKPEQCAAAIKNIMQAHLFKAADNALFSFTQLTQGGGLTAATGANMDQIEKMVPVAVAYAKKNWPEMGIKFGAIDETNSYGFGEGAAILMDDKKKNAYSFKVVDGKLHLYNYVQTDPTGAARTGKGAQKGEYIWQEVTRAPVGGVSEKERELRGAEQAQTVSEANWQKTPNRSLVTYGVESDATGGWFIAGEPAGKRNYLPQSQQEAFDQIWSQQGGQ